LKKEARLMPFLKARHGRVIKREEDGSEVLFLSGRKTFFFSYFQICSNDCDLFGFGLG